MTVIDKRFHDFADWLRKTQNIKMYTRDQIRKKIIYLVENCDAFNQEEIKTIKNFLETNYENFTKEVLPFKSLD